MPSAQAEWTEVRSWQVEKYPGFLNVADDGRVALLWSASGVGNDTVVRIYDQQGRQTSAFNALTTHDNRLKYKSRTEGLAFNGPNIATVSNGGLNKAQIITTTPTGEPVDTFEPFTAEDQYVRMDPTPVDLVIDARGDRYLAVVGRQPTFGEAKPAIYRFAADGTRIAAWAYGEGAAPGQFGKRRLFLASNGRGDVYVVDNENNRVQQFTDRGEFVRQWGQFGTGDGQFTSPADIAVAPNGDVWVVDNRPREHARAYGDGRVQRFTSDGRFIEEMVVARDGDTVAGVATDPAGRLYILTIAFGYGPSYVRVFAQTTGTAGGASVRSKALRYSKRRIAVKVGCAAGAACAGTLRVKRGSTVLGSGRYAMPGGRTATVAVKPSRRARRVLSGKRRHRVTVQLTPIKGKAVTTRHTLR